jgi:hypothetical protein
MSGLPIRWKLTLAFTLALTIVLTAVGVFLHVQLSTAVDHEIERDLRTRAAQLSGLLMREPISSLPTAAAEQLEPDETIAQILTPTGGVVAATAYADVRLLTPEQLRDAAVGEIFVDRPGDQLLDESLRVCHAGRARRALHRYRHRLTRRAVADAARFGCGGASGSLPRCRLCIVGYWVSGLAAACRRPPPPSNLDQR